MKPDPVARGLLWLAVALFVIAAVMGLSACLRTEPPPPGHEPGPHTATRTPYRTDERSEVRRPTGLAHATPRATRPARGTR